MKHRYLLPLLGLLVAAFPALAAPHACTKVEYAGAYQPNGYSFMMFPDGKVPNDLLEGKYTTLVGLFDWPVLKYPYGSLKKYGVSVDLIVGVDGRVTCASLTPFRDGDGAPEMTPQRKALLETVAGWHFLPFKLDGEAVPVAAGIPVDEEEQPARHIAMPDGNPAQMTVAYDVHGGMYGPSYHIELHGDGTAVFMPTDRNDALGPQVYQVDPKAVQALLADAQAADFWSLRDLYRESPDDFPANFTRVGITIGSVTKSVTGYEATDAGEPQQMQGLGPKIEKVAGITFWLQPTLATLDRLQAGGFDFTSKRAGALLAEWTDNDRVEEEVPLALMQKGAPLRVQSYDHDDETDLLETALGAGRVEMARRLIAAGLLQGKDGKPDPDKVNRDFIAAIDSGEAGAIDLIAPFHPDMTCADQWEPSKRVSVLFCLNEIRGYPPPPLVPLAQRLIDMGADINARNAHGETILMWQDDVAFVAFLLDHGADVNAATDYGITPLSSAMSQDVALLLLARGADPCRGNAAMDLRRRVKQEHWHRVKAWLETHGYADVLVPQPEDDASDPFSAR